MNITYPLWLVVSQWVLLFALGGLVVTLYRQLGYYLHVTTSSPANQGLDIGEAVPAFQYLPAGDGAMTPRRFEPRGDWSVLLFADPGCASCEQAVQALERAGAGGDQLSHTLIVTTAEPSRIRAIEAFQATPLPIARVQPHVADRLFRTTVTPFLFVIDPDGTVAAKGVATDHLAVRALLQKRDRGSRRALPVVVA